MKNLHILLCLVFFSLATLGVAREPEIITLPKDVSAQLKALNNKFVMFAPPKPENRARNPLIIFLHGGGGGRRPLASFTNSFLAGRISEFDQPFSLVIPQRIASKSVASGWQPADLNLLLDYLIEFQNIDKSRVYLTGYSMGGAGTWFWADKNPGRFAAIVPISAGGQTGPKDKLNVRPMVFKGLPIRAFHGSADKVCPPQQIEELVNQIKGLGGDTTLTLFEGAGHGGILERVYGKAEVWEWLLKHKRTDP